MQCKKENILSSVDRIKYIENYKPRSVRLTGHVALTREKMNRPTYRAVVGKNEGKRPLGRPRRRWEDDIEIDLREIGWGGMDWIDLAQDRDEWRAVVNTVMKLRVT
jgi:hypothetical protein